MKSDWKDITIEVLTAFFKFAEKEVPTWMNVKIFMILFHLLK
jgi:hypothetical protein